jgi:hypothetical protein
MDGKMYPQGSGTLKSRYVNGELVFYTVAGVQIYKINPTTGVITYASGATVNLASGAALQLGGVALTSTAAQLNTLGGASAGIAAVLAGGLGGSASYVKTDTGAKTILAAHATKDRACLVVVYVDEAFATGNTSATVVEVGEDDTIDKCIAHTLLVNGVTAGTVYTRAFTNTSTKKVIATITPAAGTGTGGVTVTVLAIPTT